MIEIISASLLRAGEPTEMAELKKKQKKTKQNLRLEHNVIKQDEF